MKKGKLSFLTFLFLFGIVLGSCQSASRATLIPTSSRLSITPIPFITFTPAYLPQSILESQSPQVTATLILPTKFAVSTNEAIATPNPFSARLVIKCLEIHPIVDTNFRFHGRVVLEKPAGIKFKESTGEDSLLDLATGETIRIKVPDGRDYLGYQVSPDGSKVAYFEDQMDNQSVITMRWLVVADNRLQTLAKISAKTYDRFFDAFYWLDNEHIVFTIDAQTVVVNPYTGKQIFSLDDWFPKSPGGLADYPETGWIANALPDADLHRLFYVQDDRTLILMIVDSGKILQHLPSNSNYLSSQPKWSPDYSSLVFSLLTTYKYPELFSLSRDGELERLTFLTNYYSMIRLANFSISPQNRSIAFYFYDLTELTPQHAQLAIYDSKTGLVTNYCHLGGYENFPFDPIWSPNGDQLLIGRLEPDGKTWNTVVIDLDKEYAAVLYKGLIPAGWMTSEK